MHSFQMTACFGLGILLVSSGCGGRANTGPQLVPVHGAVTFKEKPLANAVVAFLPVAPTPGRGGSAKTDAAGRFQLAQGDGATGTPAGKYRVVISKLVNPDGTDFTGAAGAPMDTDARELLPKNYSDPQGTELTANVPEQGGEANFSLK